MLGLEGVGDEVVDLKEEKSVGVCARGATIGVDDVVSAVEFEDVEVEELSAPVDGGEKKFAAAL